MAISAVVVLTVINILITAGVEIGIHRIQSFLGLSNNKSSNARKPHVTDQLPANDDDDDLTFEDMLIYRYDTGR